MHTLQSVLSHDYVIGFVIVIVCKNLEEVCTKKASTPRVYKIMEIILLCKINDVIMSLCKITIATCEFV